MVYIYGKFYRNTCVYYRFKTVCIRFLNNFTKRIKESGIDSSSPDHVEIEFHKACREAKGKDERFVSDTTNCRLSSECLRVRILSMVIVGSGRIKSWRWYSNVFTNTLKRKLSVSVCLLLRQFCWLLVVL